MRDIGSVASVNYSAEFASDGINKTLKNSELVQLSTKNNLEFAFILIKLRSVISTIRDIVPIISNILTNKGVIKIQDITNRFGRTNS
jgi:hypothetical protein